MVKINYYFVKVLKPRNLSKNIKNFQETNTQLSTWNDGKIWRRSNDKNISPKLIEIIDKLKPQLIEFMKEGYSKKICMTYQLDFRFMRKLVWGISEYENILEALFYANGWKGLIGLELSKIKLKEFQDENKRLPTQREFEVISNKIIHKRKYWTKFGINTWNDLLMATFGEVNTKFNTYLGREGLKNTREDLINFYKLKKRIPTARDKVMVPYVNVISRGIWSEFGINTWNDLLKTTFGKINKPNRLYKGKIGLERAKSELLQFFKTHKDKPTSEEKSVASILVAIKRCYWSKFGITTWNDFLHFVFGNVNVRKGIWTGKKGLDKAKKKLKDHFKKNNRLPSRRVKGMGGIVKAIQRGYWKKFGINYWNDLLLLVFGRVNQNHQKRV